MLGCSSGFPWVLIGSNMSGWLKDAGLTLSAIGYFGSVLRSMRSTFCGLLGRPSEVTAVVSSAWTKTQLDLFCQSIVLVATLFIAGSILRKISFSPLCSPCVLQRHRQHKTSPSTLSELILFQNRKNLSCHSFGYGSHRMVDRLLIAGILGVC